MKINEQLPRAGVELSVAPGAAASHRAADASVERRNVATPAAKVELSSRSRELHAALALARETPDVRPQVVAQARDRLQNGTYEVDPARIARAMLDRRA
jgi:flagellar biosynthesis anti-sigma factor FlgM